MKLSRIFRKLNLKDVVEFMGEKFLVSTVELPMPIIDVTFSKKRLFKFRTVMYETMVFKYEDGYSVADEEYCMRYKGKKEAIKCHYGMLMRMRNNYKTNRQYWRAKHDK